jgi:hypothetical protein
MVFRGVLRSLLVASFVAMSGCGPDVETRPEKLLPVLREASRCCDGKCEGIYWGDEREVACSDVREIESCLSGDRTQCPVRGSGAF